LFHGGVSAGVNRFVGFAQDLFARFRLQGAGGRFVELDRKI
jgi:hypothetical protein